MEAEWQKKMKDNDPSCTQLDLHDEEVDHARCDAIVSALRVNYTVKYVCLDRTRLDNVGGCLIVNALKENTTMNPAPCVRVVVLTLSD